MAVNLYKQVRLPEYLQSKQHNTFPMEVTTSTIDVGSDVPNGEVGMILKGRTLTDGSDTKSTLMAMRIKSVDEAGRQVSVRYIIDDSIIRMYSLPNGIADEIRKDELIEQIDIKIGVSENTEIDYIDMATDGQYYAWNADGETETGVKGDILGIDDAILIYQLAEPITTHLPPKQIIGYSGGSIHIEPVVRNIGQYNGGINVDYPIHILESVYKINTDDGTLIPIDIKDITISLDETSFTIDGAEDDEYYEYVFEYDSNLTTIPTTEYTVPSGISLPISIGMQNNLTKPKYLGEAYVLY